jgi:predicted RNA-binding Zn-ribbon protein involved in translation (DUF1610 family)
MTLRPVEQIVGARWSLYGHVSALARHLGVGYNRGSRRRRFPQERQYRTSCGSLLLASLRRLAVGLCPHCGAKVEFCPSCGQPLAAGAAGAAPPHAQPAGGPAQEAYQEREVWEGKPHIKAGIKSQTLTYRVTTERVQAIHTGLSRKTEEVELSRFKDVSPSSPWRSGWWVSAMSP